MHHHWSSGAHWPPGRRSGQAASDSDDYRRLSQTRLAAQQQRSDAEDLDMLQAISDFKNRQTGYDAALKTYSIVQQMSLLQYLK